MGDDPKKIKEVKIMGGKVKSAKPGMGGSNSGKGRSEKTAVMKAHGKKIRREEGKREIANPAES